MALPGAMIGALSNRLKVTDWVKRHPAVRDERIEAPLVVVGMFRAGTTLLTYLLERDERHRPLFRWEAGDSVPPPTPETLAADPRIEKTRQQMAMMDQINPRMRVVQSEEPGRPDRMHLDPEPGLQEPDLGGDGQCAGLWQMGCTEPTIARPTIITGGCCNCCRAAGCGASAWSLKSPHHALHLDALTATYPDARLILMHRDPLVLATSVCSLITTLTRTFSDADHKEFIARHWDRHAGTLDRQRERLPQRQSASEDRRCALRRTRRRPDRHHAPHIRRIRPRSWTVRRWPP